jgi:hypothetical protein
MKLYEYNGAEFSEEDVIAAAKEKGLSADEYIKKYNIKPLGEGEPGKKKPAAAKGAPVAGKTQGTASKPATTSSASKKAKEKPSPAATPDTPQIAPKKVDNNLITWEDLQGSEEEVQKKIESKLALYGLRPEQSGFGDYITIRGARGQMLGKAPNVKTGMDMEIDLPSVPVGGVVFKTSKEDLAKSAKKLNDYIKIHGNKNYASEALNKYSQQIRKMDSVVKSPTRNLEQKTKLFYSDLESKFIAAEKPLNANVKGRYDRSSGRGIDDNEPKKVTLKESMFTGELEGQYENYKRWKAGMPLITPSETELENFIHAKNQDEKELLSYKFMSGVSPEERTALTAINVNREKTYNEIIKEQKLLTGELTFFDVEVEEFNKNPNDPVERKRLMDKAILLQNRSNDFVAYADQNKVDINSLKAQMKAGFASYDRLEQVASNLKSTAVGLAYGAAELGSVALSAKVAAVSPFGSFSENFSNNYSFLKRNVLDPIYGVKADIGKEAEGFQRDLKVSEISDLADVGRWTAGVLTQAPSSAAMALTGEFSLPLFFLSGVGEKRYEIEKEKYDAIARIKENEEFLAKGELSPDEERMITQQIFDDRKLLNIPEGLNIASEVWSGVAELAFEKIGTLSILKNTGNVLKKLPEVTLKKTIKEVGTNFVTSVPKEGGTEFLTQVANNFGDIYLRGKKHMNVFDNAIDAGLAGGVMGPGFAAIGSINPITQALQSEVRTKQERLDRQALLDKIRQITGQVTGDNISASQIKNDPTIKAEVKDIVLEMIGKVGELDQAAMNRLANTLSYEKAYRVGEINARVRAINDAMAKASAQYLNGTLTEEELKGMKNHYEAEYTQLDKEKENILTQGATGKTKVQVGEEFERIKENFDFSFIAGNGLYNAALLAKSKLESKRKWSDSNKETKRKYYEQAELNAGRTLTKEELEIEGEELFVNEDFKKQINSDAEATRKMMTALGMSNYLELVDDKAADPNDPDSKPISAESQMLEIIKTAYENKQIGEADFKELIFDILAGTSNAFFNPTTGAMFVNVPVSIANGKVSPSSHELLHYIVKNKFNDQLVANKAGENLLNYLKEYEPGYYIIVEQQMKAYMDMKTGEKSAEFGEEIMNALSDAFRDKIPNQSVLRQVGDYLNKLTSGKFFNMNSFDPTDVDSTNGRSVYEFVKSYAEGIRRKEQGRNVKIKAASLNASVDDNKTEEAPVRSLPQSKSNLQGLLTDKYGNNKRRFISEGLMTTPSGKETFDFTKSVIGEELGGLVETITRRLYDGIPADSKKTVSREDYKNALISAAATLIDREWDPTKQDLDKFVSNRLNLRANSLAKELGIEGITEGGIKADVEQAKSLIAEETKQEVKEKPKYKTILESKVFGDEVVNSVKDKLRRELRTLKSRIDEAVSINKTVTPLIAEIKDAMGKQADIDIKKALGGKPNGEFRKNILKNKKAILENMTTTWLMGKDTKKGVEGGIPAAIQKQVDGKWLSYPDWVGKKIDREKVTTNLSGKTSGADMVRRLPNAANNISDADFLSFFLEPNGDLIRGRKESLSKAMAEELSFDIFKQGLEEGNEIADAFEKNQELKDVVLLDTYINEVAKQLDRGTVKFSKSTMKVGSREIAIPEGYMDTTDSVFRFVNGVNLLVNDTQRDGIENVFDFETNSLLEPYANEYDNFIGEFVAALYEEGKIDDKKGIQFKQAIYKNKSIPTEVRDAFKKVGNLRYNKAALDESDAAAHEIVKALDPAILKVIGYDWLGYTHRVMNAAKEREDGTPGEYYESLKSLKQGDTAKGKLPAGLIIEDIRLMNKKFPLFKKIQKILDEDISAEKKLEKLKPLQAEIEAANIANIKLAVHLGTVIGNLLKEGKISSVAALNLAQIQTGIVAGWRALSRLDLITVKDRSQKHVKGDDSRTSKGEHLAPNSNTMEAMVTVWFKAAQDNSINIEAELTKVFSEHSQWLTDVATTKAVDKAGGANNDTNFYRVKFASKEAQARVYGIDGRTYMEVLADNESRKAAIEAFGEFKAAIESEIQKDKTFDKAMSNAVKSSKSSKKIRVFDFDDTLAQTKSNVLYTMPNDPTQYKIDAATFAKEGKFLEDAGAKWDFSEFSKVMNGKKGPLFEVAKIIADKRGTNDVFVLTARPANSAGPIQEFLKSLGLDIPVKNITGLGNSSPQAKADWITGKAAEGYNDFYFADDHTGNVKAVKDALSVLDVKGKVQQAKIKNELFSPEQITALQKEIESNYNAEVKFGNENNDIRTSLFNYDDPIAQKMSNGVDLRITEGLIRDQKKTYLLYADGKPVAEFKSVDDAKNIVKFIEDNLIRPQALQNSNVKFSKSVSQRFNEIIETNKGIGAQKRYSGITSKRLGASKGNYKFFLPPNAEDFEGLLYNFIGKGKDGEEQAKFFEETLLGPYWEGVSAIESTRQKIKRDFKALKKAFPNAAKKITKRTPDGNFTYDQAIRVYLWTKEGKTIPELSRGDQARLNSLIANDPELAAFADGLELVSGRTGSWSDPSEFWDSDTIVSELNDMTEKVGRKAYLEEFIKNADEIFSDENMNKIEAIYGTDIREALEGALYRMKNGKNQTMGSGKATAAVNAWVNGSVAEIMFLNTKSGVLQLISALNYLNLRDNNPIMAGKALLDFPQFAKDFATIFNSDMMKERRQGLKEDVSAAEIANAAATAKNKARAISAYLAKIGFTPTTIADALAIGIGGAPFYRNRINTYKKQGMSEAEAEAKAWKDLIRLTNKSAQSNDPALISQIQAEPIGRIIFAFGNATMQMNRIMKKSARDLINGRGNPAEHVARILFYGFIQNAIFSALQKAVFIGLFGDDDEEEEKDKKKQKTAEEKAIELADDMLDSFLRGSGLAGAVASTAKNVTQEYFKQRAKKAKGDQAYTLIAGLNISPSIGSKARKIYGAIQEEKFNRDVIERMGGKVMLDGRFNPSPIYNVGAKVISAATNKPADRLLDKITNISEALDARNENWQRAMLMLGYKPFELGVKNEEQDAIKAQAKLEREDEVFIEGIEKKKAKIKKLRSMTQEERQAYTDSIKATIPKKIERAKRRRKLLYGK